MKGMAFAFVFLLGVGSAAAAQPAAKPAAKPGAKPTPAVQTTQADQLLSTGMAHQRSGSLDRAIADYEKGHKLSKRPVFLYLLGETHRDAGHPKEALAAFRAYLSADPNAADRGLVEEQIRLLEVEETIPAPVVQVKTPEVRLAAPGSAPSVALPPLPPPPDEGLSITAPPPKPRTQPLYKNVWLWTGVGVVAAGGVLTGLLIGLRPTEMTFVAGPGAIR